MTWFVDTNLLVYARDAAQTEKQRQAHRWLQYLWQTRRGRLSYQVLQEYYVTVTMKLAPGVAVDDARDDVRAFLAWDPLAIDAGVVEGAWRIQDKYRYSWWDSLIVSAAVHLNCDYLLSEDLQHNQDLEGVTTINPFARDAVVPSS